ncbi:MAG: CaiB/BaiF CoA-transferase family protein [Phascolarctobacterium sp.]|uniref:CaiB/BaiF CoA transferase family protein n=1 Tax=Phascolarctobacterium sp. TaxID=2049039 RepID=UPI0026DC6997|nr:CaiB/BaiF CoA-transferase family protein [Phascolarctobacterium sp.]MDO4921382.1 CaiB/BaiF CoA-transferase family protein [Phascolarctobacterium sp.]
MLALEGIRVLDMSRLLPGPYCTMLLADFGAEVIKIEEPGKGDYSRSFPPFLKDFGYWHLQLNRNKKSVTLDLKSETGKQAFLELVKTADVVVESYRPGVLQKLGVDYAAASKVNPKIIYCSLTGYGKKGPLAKQADHDIGYVSLAGITAMSGEPGGKPAIPGVLMADMNAALAAGMSIMIALRHAQATGEGQEIDISLYNVAMTLMPGAASLYFGSGFVAQRGNNWLTGANANYNIYETKDRRYLAVGCLEKKFWRNLCLALEREDMVDLVDDNAKHPYLMQQLRQEFAKRTLREWTELLAGRDTCVTPVLDFAEAVAAEQTKANEMVLTVQDEELGEYRQLGFAMKLSKTPASLRKRAPRLGEDTEAILNFLPKNKS